MGLSAGFLCHSPSATRFKGSGEEKLDLKLIMAQLPQKTQITSFLPQTPGGTNAINNRSPSPVHAGYAELEPASPTQPAVPKQVWESDLWHIMKRVCMVWGTQEFSIRANIIFNCRESACGCSSRLWRPGLPGIGNQFQGR